jgi:predicted nuclease with RNAse H fold
LITAGVDLASQARSTAVCAIDWSFSPAKVCRLAVGADDDAITELIGRADKTGIDVPLGWPVAFVDAVARHARDGSWPTDYLHADTTGYRFRRTDLWLWRHLGTSPPLSVSTDRIALPAMRAAALLARLPGRPPLDGSGAVVETYPAAALRRWGLAWRRYKRSENRDARHQLVSTFMQRTAPWLFVDEASSDLCLASDDAFDALICGLVARSCALGLVEAIPHEDRAVALREGWISLPRSGSLEELAPTGGGTV